MRLLRNALLVLLLAYLASLFLPWTTWTGGGPGRYDGWDELLGPFTGSAATAAVLWAAVVRRDGAGTFDQFVLLLGAIAVALGGLTLVNSVFGLWRDPHGREDVLYGAWVGAGLLAALALVIATAVLRQRRMSPTS